MEIIESKRKRVVSILIFMSIVMLMATPFAVSTQDVMEDSAFVSVRVYPGVDPADHNELVRLGGGGFLPIMRESEGFIAYYLLLADDVLVAISMFSSEEGALASTEAAAEFVAEFVAPLLPNPPLIVEGSIDLMYVSLLDEMMVNDDMDDESSEVDADDEMVTDDGITSLYAALRIYHDYDLSHLEEANEIVETILLPAQQEAGGLFSYYSINDGNDIVVGLSIFDTEESALAANDIAAAVVAEHMAGWIPDDVVRISGRLGVAALAGLYDGANLVAEMMDDDDMDEDESG
jgi:hypothetical protein